jgi:hypothetical protein
MDTFYHINIIIKIKNEVSKSKKKERSNKYIKRREEELNCESEELLY